MQYLVVTLLLLLAILITTSCSWRLYNIAGISTSTKMIILNLDDLNSALSRAIRNQLSLNGIEIAEKNLLYQNTPSLHVLNFNLDQDTVSIFQDGHTAEFQIILSVNTMVLIPNKGTYPINVKVYRSFFNDPQMALAKDAEQQIIVNEMYNEVAEELVRKLIIIKNNEKEIRTEELDSINPPNLLIPLKTDA